MEDSDKQEGKQFNWLKEYQWQKGQSGNPNGRPKGQTLKEWGREFLMSMSEEARIDFVEKVGEKEFWKMVEGNPAQDLTSGGEKIQQVPIYGGQSVQEHNGNAKDILPKEENKSS